MKDTRFKKGNKLGRGRPKISELTRKARFLCIEEVARIIETLSLPRDEARKIMNSPDASMLMYAVYTSIEKGDRKILLDILNRFLPKPQREEEEVLNQVVQLAYKL